MNTKPLLVIAWGNRSRGDDAMGPLLLDLLRRALDDDEAPRVELMEEHRLQPELALSLRGRDRVLLIDADVNVTPPYALEPVEPGRNASLASHTLSPQALLAVYRELHGKPPPPTTLLRLPARRFDSGRRPSKAAAEGLPSALLWVLGWVDGSFSG